MTDTPTTTVMTDDGSRTVTIAPATADDRTLKSLSASSVTTFEECPQKWKSLYLDRVPSESGDAATLGTLVHAVLEAYVKNGHHKADPSMFEVPSVILADYLKVLYPSHFSTDKFMSDAQRMLMNWLSRSLDDYWENRTVLSTETKESFTLSASLDGVEHSVPFNYIWDRADRIEHDGTYDIEVVDYKSWRKPLGPDAVRGKTQTGSYALAAHLKYPNARRIWVTMDQLRYDQVSVCYTAEEAEAMHDKLRAVLRQIIYYIESNNFPEKLGPGCQYCPRKQVCSLLRRTDDVKGAIATGDPARVAGALYEAQAKYKAQAMVVAELEEWLLREAQERDEVSFEAGDFKIDLKLSSRRSIRDHEEMADVVGADIMRREGTLTMAVVDKLLKGKDLTVSQKNALKGLIVRNWSADPKVELTAGAALTPMDDDLLS